MTRNVALNPTIILKQQDLEEKVYLARAEAMSSTQLDDLHAATMIYKYNDYSIPSRSPSLAINIGDILSGDVPLNLSHEGGEFA